MSGLALFYQGHQELGLNGNALEKACLSFLKGDEKGETLIFPLIEDLKAFSIDSPESAFVFYEQLIVALLIRNRDSIFDEDFAALLKKGKCEGYWESEQLTFAFEGLATYLMTGEPPKLNMRTLENGGALTEWKGHLLSKHLIEPWANGWMALSLCFLGWSLCDEDLMQQGMKMIEFSLMFCDHEGKLFQGLWENEERYHGKSLVHLYAFLYHLASYLAPNSKLQVTSESLLEGIKGEAPPPLLKLFAHAFHQLAEENSPLPSLPKGVMVHTHDQSLAFLRYQYQETSLACTASGAGTGLGVIHHGDIRISSFGPHYLPLSDASRYGINRFSNGKREGFSDFLIEPGEESCRFRGWTKVVSPDPLKFIPHWLFFDLQGSKENLSLTARQNRIHTDHPLYFVFYLYADRATIGESEVFLPCTLERFKGKSQQITFEGGRSTLTLLPHFEEEMEV
ncbi:MAG: hypothetical protein KDK60_04255, partial [Chlamydiia bacterium]|nr:hypothetical protein [Chlamydiia bacterium]